MLDCDCCCLSSFVYLVGLLTIASKVLPFLLKKIKGEKSVELQEKTFKKDVVYFYQFPGSPTSSSASPYCIKIEAFLRLHNIKFERRNTLTGRGENSQLPFVELNGVHYADSQIIIRRLTQIFNLKTYPDEQSAAIGHAIDRLLDNHTFNLKLMAKQSSSRMIEGMVAGKIPSVLVPLAALVGGYFLDKKQHNRAVVSIGNFKKNEYNELLKNDLVQLQTILEKKKFLLGDEPTVVDCTAFGQLGSAFYNSPASRYYANELLDSVEFTLLREYIERTKTRIFGDEFCDKK